MIKNLYIYIILAVISVYFYCYEYHNGCGFLEGYKNAEVYIGQNPKSSTHNILFMNNDNNFGWHSIYETGQIINSQQTLNKNIYDSSYGNVYGNNYAGYYNYS